DHPGCRAHHAHLPGHFREGIRSGTARRRHPGIQIRLSGRLSGDLAQRPCRRHQGRQVAESSGLKTALTFSDPNMVTFFREGLKEMLGDGVDLLFCNETEALTWTGTDDIEAAAEDLKSIARSFAITLGSEGALVFDGQDYHRIPATPVKAVDTNGAGDM